MHWQSAFKLILLLIIIPYISSCIVAAAGAGGGAALYIKGKSKTTENASLARAWSASIRACKQTSLHIIKKHKNKSDAEISARNKNDEKVVISLKSVASNKTEISVRVGLPGDEDFSIKLHTRIKKNL